MPMRSRGFTLLEVLVVISMLVIMAATVMLSFGGSDDKREAIDDAARRFQVAFSMVSEYAILNQQMLGLHVSGRSYCFVYLDENQQWQPFEGDGLMREVTLPAGLSLELQLDDLPWLGDDNLFDDGIFDETLSFNQQEQEDKPQPPPQVLIMPSGEITPFRAKFDTTQPELEATDIAVVVDGMDEIPLKRQYASELSE